MAFREGNGPDQIHITAAISRELPAQIGIGRLPFPYLNGPVAWVRNLNGNGVLAEATGNAVAIMGTSNLGDGISSDSSVRGQGLGSGVGVEAISVNYQALRAGSVFASVDIAVFAVRIFATPTRVARIDRSGRGFFNGGLQAGGADFAQSIESSGDKSKYQPGDVLAIDPSQQRRVTLSAEPYSPLVAGVYSTRPGLLAARYDMDDPRLKDEIPMAIVGIVPCKVSAENGPIDSGDLLVTASTPGHAMKGADPDRMLGAVLGKALQPLPSGTGVIEILVNRK